MQCHKCTDFGNCHHLVSCPWNSDHCVTVASREWGPGLAAGGRGEVEEAGDRRQATAGFPLPPGAAVSLQDVPLVTKMCSQGCPDPAVLGLGPRVSVSCCQASACNED